MLGQRLTWFSAMHRALSRDGKENTFLRERLPNSVQDGLQDQVRSTKLDGSVSSHAQSSGSSKGLKTDTTNGIVILVLVIAGSVVGGCTLLGYIWHRCATIDGMLTQPPPIVEPSPDSGDAFHTAHLPGRPHTHAHHHHNPHHQAVVHAESEQGHHHVRNRL